MTDDVHPVLEAHGSFRHMPLGKLPPLHDDRTLRLASYLDVATVLPQIPAEADWTLAVPAWPMYANDHLGDCTCAAAGHMIQAWTTAAGNPKTPEEAAIVEAYWALGSGDTGRYELDVLNYWRQTGIGGETIGAYALIDPHDLDAVRAAIYLFGGVYTGVALPNTAAGQASWDVVGDGKTGSSAPGSWGGHAVPYNAFGPDGFKCITWGAALEVTTAFHLAYCDELYAILSPAWLNVQGASPAGFDLAALQADLKAVTTH